ncbi:hypothetical protein Tco_1089616 [Tanacetum coccineum]
MQVLNENIVEKEIVEESPKKVKDMANELISDNLYDTESKIRTIKSFYSTQIFGLQDQYMIDADATTDLPLSDYELSEMPDDNLQSLSDIGLFESSENDDDTHSVHHSEDTIHASAELNTDLQSLHEHMNHIFKEVSLLHSNMADLESNLITKVSDDIKSIMPTLINNVFQEQLPCLLSVTLIKCLPTILTETLQAQVSTVFEQLAQTQTTLNK